MVANGELDDVTGVTIPCPSPAARQRRWVDDNNEMACPCFGCGTNSVEVPAIKRRAEATVPKVQASRWPVSRRALSPA